MYDIVKEEEHDAAAVVHCDVWNHCEVWNNISIVETSRSELIDNRHALFITFQLLTEILCYYL